MKLDIISPEKNLYSGEASSITAPGIDGSLGILNNHAALITTLIKGQLKITQNDGKDLTFDIEGGVLEVGNNTAIILAE